MSTRYSWYVRHPEQDHDQGPFPTRQDAREATPFRTRCQIFGVWEEGEAWPKKPRKKRTKTTQIVGEKQFREETYREGDIFSMPPFSLDPLEHLTPKYAIDHMTDAELLG